MNRVHRATERAKVVKKRGRGSLTLQGCGIFSDLKNQGKGEENKSKHSGAPEPVLLPSPGQIPLG